MCRGQYYKRNSVLPGEIHIPKLAESVAALYFGAEKHPSGQSLEKGVPDSRGSGLVSTPCFVNLCLHVGCPDLKTNILQNTMSGGTNSLTEALPPGAEPHCVCARRSTMGHPAWPRSVAAGVWARLFHGIFLWMELMDLHQWMSWPGDSACTALGMPSAHKC